MAKDTLKSKRPKPVILIVRQKANKPSRVESAKSADGKSIPNEESDSLESKLALRVLSDYWLP